VSGASLAELSLPPRHAFMTYSSTVDRSDCCERALQSAAVATPPTVRTGLTFRFCRPANSRTVLTLGHNRFLPNPVRNIQPTRSDFLTTRNIILAGVRS
jgi:hypothetical protein